MNIAQAARTSLSAAGLRAHLSRNGGPLILQDLVTSWPAMKDWASPIDGQITLDGLRRDVGEDTAVEVEIGKRGRGYLDPDWQRVTMGFGLFLDAFVLGRIPASDPSSVPVGYLAQAGLLDNCNALTRAVPEISHFRAGTDGDIYRRTLWVGPSRSFTPFHRDPNVGIYTQVVGTKVFHLLPPAAGPLLEPVEHGVHSNTSRIPISTRAVFEAAQAIRMAGKSESVDESVLGPGSRGDIPPRVIERCRANLEEAFKMDGACEAQLGPGDSVLIPLGWWHSAEGGDGAGVGVNAWFR